MVQLVRSLIFAVLLVSSYHLVTCSSIMETDLFESHDEDSGMIIPLIEKSADLTEEQPSKLTSNNIHNEKKVSADSDAESTTEIDRLLNENWMQEMLTLVNGERKKMGMKAVCVNAKLNTAAQAHSEDMVRKKYFAHEGADGSSAGDRIDNSNYYWFAYGENIAYNYSVQATHDAWMRSDGHRENILNREFEHMGLGLVINNKAQQYYTQLFGKSNRETCISSGPQCVDSKLRFRIKKSNGKNIARFCSWAANKKGSRCKIKGASQNCPDTCNTCSSCSDSPVAIKVWYKDAYRSKTCKWTGRKPDKIQTRCAISGMKESCRKTCSNCS